MLTRNAASGIRPFDVEMGFSLIPPVPASTPRGSRSRTPTGGPPPPRRHCIVAAEIYRGGGIYQEYRAKRETGGPGSKGPLCEGSERGEGWPSRLGNLSWVPCKLQVCSSPPSSMSPALAAHRFPSASENFQRAGAPGDPGSLPAGRPRGWDKFFFLSFFCPPLA